MPVSITIRNVPTQVEDVVAGARRRVQSTKSDVTAEEILRALRDDRR